MNWQIAVDRTVSGLGYELVDLERSGGGLLRVFIDRLAGRSYPDGGQSVTVEDCEAVTRQLQHVLEVENFDYARLEVSSPGLDRPLKKPQDYTRFTGTEVEVTLRMPVDGRKKFRGRLLAEGDGWRVVFNDGKGDQALDFTLDEVRETRLVPVLDFKGRKSKALAEPTDGGRKE